MFNKWAILLPSLKILIAMDAVITHIQKYSFETYHRRKGSLLVVNH